uniref:Uncharacterized protein n=1 Tax=Oryza sativa subsp. japonica TaxID=39947 RepID=Q6AVD7_ORYSJ|nr:hypothetical protein [Oryza sativa Japonica Group]
MNIERGLGLHVTGIEEKKGGLNFVVSARHEQRTSSCFTIRLSTVLSTVDLKRRFAYLGVLYHRPRRLRCGRTEAAAEAARDATLKHNLERQPAVTPASSSSWSYAVEPSKVTSPPLLHHHPGPQVQRWRSREPRRPPSATPRWQARDDDGMMKPELLKRSGGGVEPQVAEQDIGESAEGAAGGIQDSEDRAAKPEAHRVKPPKQGRTAGHAGKPLRLLISMGSSSVNVPRRCGLRIQHRRIPLHRLSIPRQRRRRWSRRGLPCSLGEGERESERGEEERDRDKTTPDWIEVGNSSRIESSGWSQVEGVIQRKNGNKNPEPLFDSVPLIPPPLSAPTITPVFAAATSLLCPSAACQPEFGQRPPLLIGVGVWSNPYVIPHSVRECEARRTVRNDGEGAVEAEGNVLQRLWVLIRPKHCGVGVGERRRIGGCMSIHGEYKTIPLDMDAVGAPTIGEPFSPLSHLLPSPSHLSIDEEAITMTGAELGLVAAATTLSVALFSPQLWSLLLFHYQPLPCRPSGHPAASKSKGDGIAAGSARLPTTTDCTCNTSTNHAAANLTPLPNSHTTGFRLYIHKDLKYEYMLETSPLNLWKALKGEIKYFQTLKKREGKVLTIAERDTVIVGSGRATITLLMGTPITIEDALLYPDSTRTLLNYRDIHQNGFHIETHMYNREEFLLLTKQNGYGKRICEKIPSCTSGLYYTYIKPVAMLRIKFLRSLHDVSNILIIIISKIVFTDIWNNERAMIKGWIRSRGSIMK